MPKKMNMGGRALGLASVGGKAFGLARRDDEGDMVEDGGESGSCGYHYRIFLYGEEMQNDDNCPESEKAE